METKKKNRNNPKFETMRSFFSPGYTVDTIVGMCERLMCGFGNE